MTILAHDYTEADEHLAHVRAQLLSDVADALRSLQHAITHLDALRAVDHRFATGRDGRDIHAHLDNAIRDGRASYALTGMVISGERL